MMNTKLKNYRFLLLLVAFSLVLAACGGTDGSNNDGSCTIYSSAGFIEDTKAEGIVLSAQDKADIGAKGDDNGCLTKSEVSTFIAEFYPDGEEAGADEADGDTAEEVYTVSEAKALLETEGIVFDLTLYGQLNDFAVDGELTFDEILEFAEMAAPEVEATEVPDDTEADDTGDDDDGGDTEPVDDPVVKCDPANPDDLYFVLKSGQRISTSDPETLSGLISEEQMASLKPEVTMSFCTDKVNVSLSGAYVYGSNGFMFETQQPEGGCTDATEVDCGVKGLMVPGIVYDVSWGVAGTWASEDIMSWVLQLEYLAE